MPEKLHDATSARSAAVITKQRLPSTYSTWIFYFFIHLQSIVNKSVDSFPLQRSSKLWWLRSTIPDAPARETLATTWVTFAHKWQPIRRFAHVYFRFLRSKFVKLCNFFSAGHSFNLATDWWILLARRTCLYEIYSGEFPKPKEGNHNILFNTSVTASSNLQENAEVAVREMMKNAAEDVLARTGRRELFAEDFMDDGSTLSLHVRFDSYGGAIFDFTGTSPQVLGNWNAPPAVTLSCIIYCLRCMVGHNIPLNQGCLKPIQVGPAAINWAYLPSVAFTSVEVVLCIGRCPKSKRFLEKCASINSMIRR